MLSCCGCLPKRMAGDEEWRSLLEFSRQFRQEKNITASQLVIQLDLPVTMIQYLYNSKMIPSKKKNTKASQLRERLRQLREDHERELAEECTRSDESFPELSFVDQIFDFEMLHEEELSHIGVDNLFCSEEEDGKKFVTAIVREAVDIEILTSKLRELGLGDDCQITAERFYFASHFETPCCMQSQSAQAGYGTGNFLLTSLGLMGVTAAHVVLPMMEKETVRECRERVSQDGTNFFIHAYPLSHRDPLTHRYPLAHQPLQVLGHTAVADVHESLDIAIFHPSAEHSYLVNKLDCDISFKPSEKLLDLLKKTPHREVIKQGCGTNVTRGTISSSSPQTFVVRSVEASWFCTPGDSGSFILAKDPTADPESDIYIVVGVLSKHDHSALEAIPSLATDAIEAVSLE
jgi:hypothetical protein